VILGRVAAAATVIALAFTGTANAVTITEFEANPGKSATPNNIVAGPGGNLWWTELGAEPGIGRISPTGEHFPVIHTETTPIDLAAAPSGWVSWVSQSGLGMRNPSGTVYQVLESSNFRAGSITLTPAGQIRFGGGEGASVTVICAPPDPTSDHLDFEFPKYSCAGVKNGSAVDGIAASPGGTLWASVPESNAMFISSTASFGFTTRVELPIGSRPVGIAIGPEGNAWVAMWEAGAIDRITPTGARTRFTLPAGSKPNDLVLGPDGAFWIVEAGTGKIARMTTAGLVTNEYAVPSGETGQTGITVGPDKNLWFTDSEVGLIGRLIPDPLVPAGETGGGGTVPPPGDTVPPRFIGAPAFSPARFRVGGPKPSGSTLKFSLSEASTITATVARKASGRRAGKNCVAPSKAKPGAKMCTRYVLKGNLTLKGAAGANKVAFSGKLRGKALPPGSYRSTLVARDVAGNTSSAAKASFSIVP
jgi:streptogramin lyase